MPTAPKPKPKVAAASTGKDAELAETLAISSRRRPKAVLSMAQGGAAHASLPDVKPGDRLLISGELAVTTDCARQQSDCVGKPYPYAPNVEAALLFAGDAGAVAARAGRAIEIARIGRLVTHARHHDVLVFDNAEYVVPKAGLPWQGPAYLNMAATAVSPQAKAGHKLIIGQHEPGGQVKGDMGGLSVIRFRPGAQALPQALRTTALSVTSIPVVTGQRSVVYSLRLEGLEKGEQIRVRSRIKASSAHLSYSVRMTTELILSDSPTSTDPGRGAKRVSPDSPQICRGNGFNCLRAESPATATKAGAMRIVADAAGPLFVNACVVVGDPLKKSGPGQALVIVDAGMLEVVRFPGALTG